MFGRGIPDRREFLSIAKVLAAFTRGSLWNNQARQSHVSLKTLRTLTPTLSLSTWRGGKKSDAIAVWTRTTKGSKISNPNSAHTRYSAEFARLICSIRPRRGNASHRSLPPRPGWPVYPVDLCRAVHLLPRPHGRCSWECALPCA